MKLISKMMISCRKASELSSAAMERELDRGERWSLAVHNAICGACKRFSKQLDCIRNAIKCDCEREYGVCPEKLSDEAKQKICERVSKEVS